MSNSNQISGLSAGWRTTCGIFNEQLQCFGWNQYGQVGVGGSTSVDQFLPVAIEGDLPAVDFVAPGVVHTCAVTEDRARLYCWGSNDSVNLLLADPIIYTTPQPVSVGGRVRQLTSGRSHICAVVDVGEFDRFLCWGLNEYGQLGIDSNLAAEDPVEVQLSGLPKQISAGYLHQCAVLATDDSLWCWGLNFNGQVGVGSEENVFVPTKVSEVGQIKMVSSGYYHTCAVTLEGFVYCFGYNANGQLGIGNTDDQTTPQFVSLGGRADSVVTGHYHTCAIMTDSSLKCWGSNSFGQLGVGEGTTQSTTPISVSSIGSDSSVSQVDASGGLVKSLALGKEHSCASLQDETLWCWGNNSNGQLGLGEQIVLQYLPAQVSIQFPGAGNNNNPTQSPTSMAPVMVPTTGNPSRSPTRSPTKAPTTAPTRSPTRSPTRDPTPEPTTGRPTTRPTDGLEMTQRPTTAKPTPFRSPTDAPTSTTSAPVVAGPSEVEPRPTSIILVFPTEQEEAENFGGGDDSVSAASRRMTLLSALSLTLLLCWGQTVL